MVYKSKIAKRQKDDFEYIRKYVKKNDLRGLAREVQKKAKQINQRLYRIKKAGLSKSSYAYRRTIEEEGKPRYTTSLNKLNKMSRQELVQQAYNIQSKLSSTTSTIRGTKALNERRIFKGLDALREEINRTRDDIEIDEQDFKKFLEQGGGEILNNKFYDSTQVIEDWQDNIKKGISTEQFVNSYNEYVEQEEHAFNYQQFLNKLKSIKG
nr:MAG TPA: hypothetical protein [Caudoviricetes sp.]